MRAESGRADERLCCSDYQRAKAGHVGRSVGRLVTAQRRQWRSYTRSQSRRRRQVTWKCPVCRNKHWQDRRCTTCGWLWTLQGFEPVGQPGALPEIEAPTEILDAEIAIPKARLARPVGATLDSALARQDRAKKNLGLVEVQLTAAQQKMEEAKTEMAAADKSVNEARQLAVQDTSIFADAEVLVQARSRCECPRRPREDGRGLDRHESDATKTAAGSANDANNHPRVRAVEQSCQ